MPVAQILLILTTLIAVVALGVALVVLLKMRQMVADARRADRPSDVVSPGQEVVPLVHVEAELVDPVEPGYAVVEGKVLVQPSPQQVRAAIVGRPLVRLNVVVVGMAHALRPESRDRIRGLMRREFRARKKQRRQAARRAAYAHQPANSSTPVVAVPDRRELGS
ncbi:MAG: hypothetical protein JWP10_483 [Nocardioidaceae bacterium]|nr:hypothetical protein [Nocardioidaceae bacterium]